MARKPPIKFKQSPAANDDEALTLAKRLESSRKTHKPQNADGGSQRNRLAKTRKPIAKTPTAKNKGQKPNEAVTISIPMTKKIETAIGKKAVELGTSIDYVKRATLEQTRRSMVHDLNKTGNRVGRRIADILDNPEKKIGNWARLTLTIPSQSINDIRDLVGDKLNAHKKATLLTAAFLAMMEISIPELGKGD